MYAPHTERDIAQMLEVVGVESLDDLLSVPDAIALKEKL
jgi:glycine cleavage system pyridoxal-binding protein P